MSEAYAGEDVATALERLNRYARNGFDTVQGWVDPVIFHSLRAIHHIQAALGIAGPIYEIGIFQGRFFLALDQLKEPDEPSVAIDLFDAQELNIDGSGSARLDRFRENLAKYSASPDSVEILSQDSTMIAPEFLAELRRRHGLARLFSVDGGHTVEHTVNDLRIAQQMTANGGVVFLDDYYNPAWPGVHEGFARFMMLETPKIVPFAFSGNKLMLTTLSRHRQFAERYFNAAQNNKSVRAKKVRMYGYDVTVVHQLPPA